MKDSGIEWIGEIPESWEQGRLKNLSIMISKGATPSTIDDEAYEGNVRFIKCENILNNKLVNNSLYYISHDINETMRRSKLMENDVLFVIAGTIGKTAIVTKDFLPSNTNQAVSFIRLKNISDAKFVWYVLQSNIIQIPLWINAVQSAQPNLSMEDLGNFKMPIPSNEERQQIADYLDKKCSEIDEMVVLQEKIIEELKAYKQSVITEAVTKGLNPDVQMKDSGIEWIGEIPENWEACRMKNVAELFGRIGFRGYTSEDLNKDGEGAITLSPSNMLPMGMDYSNVTYLSWFKYHESPEIKIQNGDILMVKTGSSYGKVSYVEDLPKEATINPQILRIVSKINSKYLGYYMQTTFFTYQVEGSVVGGTIPTISQEKIYNFYVLLPPLSEQQSIASYLDEKCSEIDSLISIKQSKIESLKEYKKSIIYEYVTGKKEVE